MHQLTKFIPAVAVSSLLLAACGSSSGGSSRAPASQPSSPSASALVKITSVPSLGASVLVDSEGLTLYRLSGEQNGKWMCTSTTCVRAWHPLAAPAGSTPTGSVGSLGTVRRPGGTGQVTYKGMPLYTFVGDTKAGEAKGQGIKDVGVWTAVPTAHATTTKPAAATTAPAPSSGGASNYGY